MFFENRTEMDATVRVIKVLLTVCKDIYASTSQKVRICCQPTFQHHATFTDFLICRNEAGMYKLLIEVKNPTVYTNLRLKSKEAAQVFREVHIVLENVPTPFPFVLTNSIVWSFGVAQRVANRLSILCTLEANIDTSQETIYQVLWKYLNIHT